MTTTRAIAVLLVLAASFAEACAESEPEPAQAPSAAHASVVGASPSPEAPPAVAPSAATTAATVPVSPPGPGPGGGAGRRPHPPMGATVSVTLDGHGIDVPLASVPHAGPAPTLVELWKAAFPDVDPGPLRFNLVSAMGPRRVARPRCASPLSGSQIASLHIDPTTHDATVDPGVGVPHCYTTFAVVSVDASR